MAYQPKSYRKFVATAATATLVASAFAPLASAAAFTDVAPKYKDAVDFVVSKGASGTSETTFSPDKNITRGDAAALLVQVKGYDTEKAPKSGFKDVNSRQEPYIAALKEAGITAGKTATTFKPNDQITRGELAIWIAKAFDLKAGSTDSNFKDVNKNYEAYVNALVANGVAQGTNSTTFGTDNNAKRGDFAIFLYKAANVKVDVPPVESNVKVKSVSAITATNVTVEFDELLEDMVDAHIIVRDAAGKYVPTKKATLKAGAKSATFQFETPLTVNPTNEWTVNGVAYKAPEFAIAGVESVDVRGKYINVQFNQKVTDLDASEISVRNAGTQRAYGVESVKLSADGYSAMVTMIGNDSNNNILTQGVKYTLSITKGGKVTSGEFVIPQVLEERTVLGVDPSTRTVTYTTSASPGYATVIVPKSVAFDFQEALGRDVTFWLNEDNQVSDFTILQENVLYDAIEVSKNSSGKYLVKPANSEQAYEIDANVEVVFVDGAGDTTVDTTDLNALVSAKDFNSAKIVIGKDGKVQALVANDFAHEILVEKVNTTYVASYGNEVNFKDYVITKNGKTISVADLQPGDVVFYHSSPKIAEVYTNKVTGTISNFYDGEFKLNNKVYKYNGSPVLTSGGWVALDDDSIKPFTKTVNAYTDRAGNLIALTGEEGQVVTNTNAGLVTKAGVGYKVGTTSTLEFTTHSTAGTVESHKVDPSKLTRVVVNGVTYTTSKLTTAEAAVAGSEGEVGGFYFDSSVEGAATNTLHLEYTDEDGNKNQNIASSATLAQLFAVDNIVEVTKDADGNVVGLNIKDIQVNPALGTNPTAPTNYTTFADTLSKDAKITDTIVYGASPANKSYKITADTPVLIDYDKIAGKTGSKEQVVSTTFGKLPVNTIDVTNAKVKIYYDNKDSNKVAYLVVDADSSLTDGTNITKSEGVLKSVRTKDNKVVEAVLIINGVDTTFTSVASSATAISEANIGKVVDIDINKSIPTQIDGAGLDVAPERVTFNFANATDAGIINTSRNALISGGVEYKLESNAKIYEVVLENGEMVIKPILSLSDLASKAVAGKQLTVSTVAAGNTYIDTILVTDATVTPTGVAFTSDPTPAAGKLTFTAALGSTVAISIDDTTAGTAAVTYTVTGTGAAQTVNVNLSTLTDGQTVTATVTATNVGGTSTSVTDTAVLDKTAPAAVSSPTPTTTGFSAAGLEVGATVKVVADGAASTSTALATEVVPVGGSVTVTGLTGATAYDVYVIDTAGNVSAKVDITTL